MTRLTDCIESMVISYPAREGLLFEALLTSLEGPIVRITPDEVHVQEQFSSPGNAGCWVKGTEVLRQSKEASQGVQDRKRSIWPVRSILKVEVHHIFRGLVRRHQVQRAFSSRGRTFISIAELRGTRGDQSGASDLEDGSPRVLLSAQGGSMSRSSQERKDQLPPPGNTGSRSWQAQGFSGQALYCIRRCRGWVVKLYHFETCTELSEFQTRKSRRGDARECAYWHTRPYEMIKFGQWFNGPRRDAQYRRRRFKVTERGIGRTCVRIEWQQ
jgi:hypothetical protein